ncbi:MAG: hypothetical protein ACM3NO_01165 [Deltaproteobacteria bacterium]
MKLKAIASAILLVLLTFSVSATAGEKKPKPGPLTGTWECTAHGFSEGDLPFTLMLEQTGDQVTGSVESPRGGTGITSATYKKKVLEIRIEAPDGIYLLSATLKKDRLIGSWSRDPEKGTWEGSKQDPSSK